MPTLYIVATPIGNLEDITLRAINILKEVDFILCEDTRHTSRLLKHYDIDTKTVSYHQHSKLTKTAWIIDQLKKSKSLALVSDAGTPCISDPGTALVAEVVRALGEEVDISPLPGASAVISALSASGLPTNEFLFLGFLPHKKGRETMFKRINESSVTTVFYESTHRIVKALESLVASLEHDRQIVVCRELTKQYESVYRGSAGEVLQQLHSDSTKGEFVVIVSPK